MNSLTLFQTSPYKSFADYTDIQPLNGRNDQFIAKEKNKSRIEDECYDEKWYLLIRAGLYRAQVEKALSEMYHHFLGYSTDIEILKKHEDYYVASRAIANYISFFDSAKFLQLKSDDSLLLNGYPTVGLGKICALTDFFKDNDAAPGNFGFQLLKNKNVYRAFKIDSEKSLDLDDEPNDEPNDEPTIDEEENGISGEKESLKLEVKSISTIYLNKDITETEWFKKEEQEMLDQIAAEDFSIIENILRKNITSNIIETTRWIANHLVDDIDKNKMLSQLDSLQPQDLKKYELDAIIEQFKDKHTQLRNERFPVLLA